MDELNMDLHCNDPGNLPCKHRQWIRVEDKKNHPTGNGQPLFAVIARCYQCPACGKIREWKINRGARDTEAEALKEAKQRW